jgi:hypothetical protein
MIGGSLSQFQSAFKRQPRSFGQIVLSRANLYGFIAAVQKERVQIQFYCMDGAQPERRAAQRLSLSTTFQERLRRTAIFVGQLHDRFNARA